MSDPKTVQPLYDREAEDALIGAVLLDPDLLERLAVEAADFYIVRNRWTWEAFLALRGQRMQIDILTVERALEDQKRLQEMGAGYLLGLINACPFGPNAEAYARIVTDLSVRRRLVATANEIAQQAYNPQTSTDDIISDSAVRLANLARPEGGAQLVRNFVSAHYDRVEAASRGEGGTLIPTGFPDLDRCLCGGLRGGELLILTGKPGLGKTKFLLKIANEMAMAGHPGVVYELETGEDEILDREFSRQTHLPSEWFETGALGDEGWKVYVQAVERMSANYPLYLDFNQGWTTTSIRADLIRLKREANIQWFAVDYMKFLDDKPGLETLDRLNFISRQLKRICRELNLIGIVIHQLNKAGMAEKAPTLDKLAQGSDIGYDADRVLVMAEHVPDVERGEVVNPDWVTCLFVKSRRKLEQRFFHMLAMKAYPDFGPITRRHP